MAFHRLPRALLEVQLVTLLPVRLGFSFRPIQSSHFSSSSRCRQDKPVGLRFAPSPTGYLHLGGLRTALFNHLLARKLGGSWTLRIEDTDQTRYVDGAVESLIKTLEWAKLDYDEGPGKDRGRGPYFQSQRKHIYDNYLDKLLDSGRAYHCFCSPARLAETRKILQASGSNSTYDRKCLGLHKDQAMERSAKGEKSVVRFKSSTASLTQEDLVYGSIHYDSLPLEDFVLRKSDGLPTYHFANVVDDHEMGITHVLRGEEWLPSTPKHLALYTALELQPPKFAHMPLLINPDGSKLSKRAGDVRVEDYIARGYEPEALLNFVALMGWSPSSSSGGPESEVMSLPDLIQAFSLDNINKNRATMSPTKLDFLNRAHLQEKLRPGNELARNEVAERAKVFIVAKYPNSASLDLPYIARAVASLKERIHTVRDVPNIGGYFFADADLSTPAAAALFQTTSIEVYRDALTRSIRILIDLSAETFAETSSNDLWEALSTLIGHGSLRSTKDLMNPLRHALTGQRVGAGVPATIGTLGREETLRRLRAALARIEEL